ncbi:MAG TPA: serine hydrolase, partial [Bacillota bacterium]|nr:serine hydrolase [Bacillota bacterium]
MAAVIAALSGFFAVQALQETSARAAVVMDVNSNRILYSKNMDEKLAMASTTKIMTALVAIESGRLDEKVTISKRASYMEGSSIYLREGEVHTVSDLLYAIMLRSGNDAATAVAEHIGGSVEGFAEMMNKKAREIGASNTRFANPHGLDAEGHYTTARDLALITSYALKNP